jgi:hypothetical protein
MSEDPRVPVDTSSRTGPTPKPQHYLHIVLTAVAVCIVFIFDTGELVKSFKGAEAKTSGMFSIPSQIFDEFKSCNYEYLFVCELKPGVAKCRSEAAGYDEQEVCISMATSPAFGAPAPATRWWESIPMLNVIAYAGVMLPRLPDALIQMLKERWSEGRLEFSLGVVFVLAYFALMVVALRSKSSANFWFFVLAVVYGPYLVIGVFWVLQQAFAGAAAGASALAAWLISAVGLPTCLLICVGHDAESVAKAFKVFGKRAAI